MPTMPNVIGQNYSEAVLNLTNAGVYVPVPSYAFQPPQITVQWRQRTNGDPGGTIVGQLPAANASVSKGEAITLTVSNFPMAAVIESTGGFIPSGGYYG